MLFQDPKIVLLRLVIDQLEILIFLGKSTSEEEHLDPCWAKSRPSSCKDKKIVLLHLVIDQLEILLFLGCWSLIGQVDSVRDEEPQVLVTQTIVSVIVGVFDFPSKKFQGGLCVFPMMIENLGQ